MILITGGAGFIGTNFIRHWRSVKDEGLLNLDKLTYCGCRRSTADLERQGAYEFVQGDICDPIIVRELLAKYRPRAIINFAAESHVDRSIHDPTEFVRTNVVGTQVLLSTCLQYWKETLAQESTFRFLHVSTDEVYGSLKEGEQAFREGDPYDPSSPYAASKAASDHLVRAFHRTYGFPALVTNCSNNYGPYQYPEKLIPLTILRLLREQKVPVYGDGRNIRDWLHVEDHCRALVAALESGLPGETYNIGARSEARNIEIVRFLCAEIASRKQESAGKYEALIEFVPDRLGHDYRYAIDPSKVEKELGWHPTFEMQEGLRRTVEWYIAHPDWVAHVASGSYNSWLQTHYAGSAR